jgi:hypothetical protein
MIVDASDDDGDVEVITQSPEEVAKSLPPELRAAYLQFHEHAQTPKYIPQTTFDAEAEHAKAAAVLETANPNSARQARRNRPWNAAKLKLVVARPDLVETHDCNAPDPVTLLAMKAYRNTVPVPKHWCQKRRYLSRKVGQDRVSKYNLPNDVISAGVPRIRLHYVNRSKSSFSMQNIKGGGDKPLVEYDKLMDCFIQPNIRYRLTSFGEMYYEGKEYEIRCKDARPGILSSTLRKALGMPSEDYPPPWLNNMQAHGPPPSYPSLKLMGVNAPIPKGASWGFGAGQWGKPPLDGMNKGRFGGDLFAQHGTDVEDPSLRVLWGELSEAAPVDTSGPIPMAVSVPVQPVVTVMPPVAPLPQWNPFVAAPELVVPQLPVPAVTSFATPHNMGPRVAPLPQPSGGFAPPIYGYNPQPGMGAPPLGYPPSAPYGVPPPGYPTMPGMMNPVPYQPPPPRAPVDALKKAASTIRF